jgi:hypothetical protein
MKPTVSFSPDDGLALGAADDGAAELGAAELGAALEALGDVLAPLFGVPQETSVKARMVISMIAAILFIVTLL